MADRSAMAHVSDPGIYWLAPLRDARPTQLDRRVSRRWLSAIDDCLDALEALHIASRSLPTKSACRVVLDALVSRGVQPPAAVCAARNSYVLHEALLDWQELVLDELLRQREARLG